MEQIIVQCASCQKRFKIAAQGSARTCPNCQGMLVPNTPQPAVSQQPTRALRPIPLQQPTAAQQPVTAHQPTAAHAQQPVAAQSPVAASSAAGTPSFDFEGTSERTMKTSSRVRRRKNNWWMPATLVVLVLGMVAAVGIVLNQGGEQPQLLLAKVPDQMVQEQDRLSVQFAVNTSDLGNERVRYSLTEAPSGANIDDHSGLLEWSPSAAGKYQITVQAEAGGTVSKSSFQVTVMSQKRNPGLAKADDAGGGRLGTSTLPAMEQELATADEDPILDLISSTNTSSADGAASMPAEPLNTTEPLADPSQPQPEETASTKTDPELELLLPLYTNKTLYTLKQYAPVRHFYAERFATQHLDQIKQALGEDYEPFMQWLADHEDIKEELYTAIDEKHDSIPQVFGLFRDLWKKFPSKIGPYANLAIAIAVTWDSPRAIYDYTSHQTRAKSSMPDELVDAIGNFQYMIDAEQYMQNRGQLLPWEFLVLLVDHKTPVMERGWAMQNYVARRVMFGKCYSDVPYDHTMLNSGSAVAKLNGQVYSLPNLKNFGGVCAHQADYAARVGKSIGVPGAYVRGESRYGELHAWIMWIELKSVTKQGIVFSLESHGRYRGDKYYVGQLTDPQTGQEITDRQLELRLNTIGVDVLAKRHSDRLMVAFSVLRDAEKLSVSDQLTYLRQVVNLCPGNEQAWQAIADLSAAAADDLKLKKQVLANLDTLFTTFANFPDFTWTIFDKMIAFQTKNEERNSLYLKLIQLYFSAQRPDLACEASMKLADDLFNQGSVDTSIEVLATAIKFFPDEGRYVPRMLDRLEQAAANVEGSEQKLVLFYTQFLPLIPQKRGDKTSDYCVQMYQRGIAVFQKNNQPALAQGLQAQLSKLTGG